MTRLRHAELKNRALRVNNSRNDLPSSWNIICYMYGYTPTLRCCKNSFILGRPFFQRIRSPSTSRMSVRLSLRSLGQITLVLNSALPVSRSATTGCTSVGQTNAPSVNQECLSWSYLVSLRTLDGIIISRLCFITLGLHVQYSYSVTPSYPSHSPSPHTPPQPLSSNFSIMTSTWVWSFFWKGGKLWTLVCLFYSYRW